MKQRIFLGLAPLFVLLIATGAYAVTLFAKLGNQVDVILRENFRSVIAGQQMKETAERMDSALFFSLVGEENRGRELYAQSLPVFGESLRAELANITLPGEASLAEKLQLDHQRYAARVDVFWATANTDARRKMYFDEMLPAFTAIKDTAQEIIRINQDNMVQADRNARRLSAQSTSGDLEYSGTLAKGGRYSVNSHSGGIRLAISGPIGFEFSGASFSGSIRADADGRVTTGLNNNSVTVDGRTGVRRGPVNGEALQATFGDGSAIVTARTFSGDIVLTKR